MIKLVEIVVYYARVIAQDKRALFIKVPSAGRGAGYKNKIYCVQWK